MAERYIQAYERLTGQTFVPGEQPAAERIAAQYGAVSRRSRSLVVAFVPILMGSRSDLKHAQTIAAALEKFGIDVGNPGCVGA